MEKRCSFELFKSNVCHWLKEEGDIDFLIQVLESDLIRKYYNDSAQKTPAVRKNVRGMNALITNNATIIEECRNWMPELYRITPEELEEINQLLEEMDKMEQRGGRGSRGR